VVFTDAATTGDGLLTALNLMAALVHTGRSLAELASIVQRLPQVLINVPVVDKEKVAKAESVAKAVSIAERALGGSGRILLRPSGTENLVRVMVEAPTVEQAEDTAHDVVAAVQAVR